MYFFKVLKCGGGVVKCSEEHTCLYADTDKFQKQ